ncbi:unnamed protein product [Closterium sp. NIES-64]|nr:unnamed protein product [Closterium sp. NIES-64]
MASRLLVSGLPRSLPPLPQGPGPACVHCVEGRQRAAPHSSQFPPTEAPLQTLHMDVWGPARVRGQGRERYFLLVVDDYSRYTTVFPLRSKGEVTESFTLPDSPQQNGIAERRIGMVMDVARTSMMHAAAPHFLWPFAVRYAAHQINLHPRVSRPETSPALLWTGKVGDASAFRVWGSRAFVRDLSADKLSPRAAPYVFLGFPPDAPGWQFYHPTSRRVLSSQDVTFDESVPYYRLFPYRTPSLPPPPLFLVPGPPPVDPLPPQGPAPSCVSQVDAVEPVEVTGDSGAAAGAEPGGAEPGGAEPGGAVPGGSVPGGAEPGGAETGGAEPGGAEPGGAEPGGAEPGGAAPGGAEPEGAEPGGAEPGGAVPGGASSRREPLSPQELREWFARRWRRAAGAGGSSAAEGTAAARPGGARTVGAGAAGSEDSPGAGAAEGVGAVPAGGGPTDSAPGAAAGGSGAAGGATVVGAPAGGTGAVPAVSGVAARPRPYFVPLLQQVLGLTPPPPLEGSQPVWSQPQLQPASPLPAPSPYAGPTGGLTERREPASRPASPVRIERASGRGSRQRPPPVPGTHRMSLRPSTAPLRAPLPSPPASSLPALADPESDSLRAASPTVTRLLATAVTDPSFESSAASALVTELVDFAARCRLDYAASLVAESESACPPSVGGECALGTDVLEDRQEEFQCLAAASPHLASVLLAPEGDPDAPDIPTPRSYAEAIEGPYSSQWQAAMDAEMASWKSTGTYVDAVPPPRANIISGMWIFRVKRPPGSPPVFKARYVARGFSQRQGVDYFQTFSPTPKMTTLRVLLHVAAHRDYELHSLDFSTAFLQGSLHEEIWLRRPPGFTESFPPGTQWSLRSHNDTGPVIVKTVDSKTAKKTGEYLAGLIRTSIAEVGGKKVVQVVMDNASNNRRAADILQDGFPAVFFNNCAAHVLDLMLHDIGRVRAVRRVLNQVHRVVMIVKGSASAVTLFHELFSTLSLVRPGATRFGTQVIMLARFLEVKKALKEMIISEEWELVAVAQSEEGRAVRHLLLDEVFWECATAVLRLMTPVYEVLRVVDTRALVMGQIYGLMLDATVKTNNAAEAAAKMMMKRTALLPAKDKPAFLAAIKAIIARRWDSQLHNPLHAMGWLLNPRNQYGKEVKNDPEVRLGAEAVIQARGEDVAQRTLLLVQLTQFHKGEGLIGSDDARWAATVLVASGRLTEAEWWLMYGGELRALMGMAVTVLSQPVTSSEVERYWSAIARVQRRDRNRLSANKMMDVTEVAFARRARDAFDRKSRQREKLYANLANGTLQQGSAVEPAAAEEEEVGDDEEEGEGNEQLCTIDWDLFGNIGKRKKKGPKTAKRKRNEKAKKPTKRKRKATSVREEEGEEEEAADSSGGEEEDVPTKARNGADPWDISDGSSGEEEEEADEDEEEEEDE